MAAWYNDKTFITAFFDVLVQAGMLEDMDDAREYMKKPYKYDSEYGTWAKMGYPTPEDEDWDDFVEIIMGEESDDEGEGAEEAEAEDNEDSEGA